MQAVSADFIKSAALADIKYKEEAMPGEIVIAAERAFPLRRRYAIITYSRPVTNYHRICKLTESDTLARRQKSRLTEQSPEN